MEKEEYFENVVVASFDILGFKEKIRKDSRIASKVLGNFVRNAQYGRTAYSAEVDFSKPGFESKKMFDLYSSIERFSDSLFVYGNPNEAIEDQLDKICGMAAKTVAIGLMCDRPYLVRCGIGTGDLVSKTISTFNEETTFFTGNSILNAYQIECEQNWAGGALHEDLVKFARGSNICKYKSIPWKFSKRSSIAIDWAGMILKDNSSTAHWVETIIKAYDSQDPSVLIKMENTIEYFKTRVKGNLGATAV
jgi:hypothetical protein